MSYHLKQLLNAGIVTREKRGSFAYFSIEPAALERIRDLLAVPVPAVAADGRSGRAAAFAELAPRDRHAGRSGRLDVTADRRGRAVVRQYDVGRRGGGDVGIERPDDGDRAQAAD